MPRLHVFVFLWKRNFFFQGLAFHPYIYLLQTVTENATFQKHSPDWKFRRFSRSRVDTSIWNCWIEFNGHCFREVPFLVTVFIRKRIRVGRQIRSKQHVRPEAKTATCGRGPIWRSKISLKLKMTEFIHVGTGNQFSDLSDWENKRELSSCWSFSISTWLEPGVRDKCARYQNMQ